MVVERDCCEDSVASAKEVGSRYCREAGRYAPLADRRDRRRPQPVLRRRGAILRFLIVTPSPIFLRLAGGIVGAAE